MSNINYISKGTPTFPSPANGPSICVDTVNNVMYVSNGSGGWTAGVVPGNVVLPSVLSASGAVPPNTAASYLVTKAGVAALTLAAPTVGTSDGLEITITSNTANAHTLTATGLLNTGSASVNVATFAAFAGAGLTLMAYQGKWSVLAQVGITFS